MNLMIERVHHLKDWNRSSSFYPELELLISIKSFDLKAIRARYLAARSNLSGRGGSVERRAVSLGGISHLKLSKGSAVEINTISDLKEPRGLSSAGNRLAFSLENTVIIIDEKAVYSFSNPWFSYIHTVAFHPSKKDVVLVSSSGFDALFEYHYPSGEQIGEWFSWENGINQAKNKEGNKIHLTRSKDQHLAWEAQGIQHLFINDPLKDHLPTAQRAAFINTASYSEEGDILATLFHEGSVRRIDRASGESKIAIAGLRNPHGGFMISGGKIMATNTGEGELWIAEENSRTKFIANGLPDKAPEMGNSEWWQNAVAWGEFYLVIDSNRNAIIVIDPSQKQYDLVPFNENWAVQDLIVLNGSEPSFKEYLEAFRVKD